MSDVDGTCEYVLDPDNPETWGGEEGDECYVEEDVLNEDGVWTCPHDAEEGEDLCIFHMPIENKQNDMVNNTLIETINSGGNVDKEINLIGSKFKRIGLSGENVGVTEKESLINLSHSVVREGIDWSGSNIGPAVDCAGIICDSNIDISGLSIYNGISFLGASVNGSIDLRESKINADVDFSGARVSNSVKIGGKEKNSKFFLVDDVGANIDGDLFFSGSSIHDDLLFDDCDINGDVIIGGDAFFGGTGISGDVSLQNVEIKGNIRSGVESGTVIKGSMYMLSGVIDGSVLFSGNFPTSIEDELVIMKFEVGGDIDFSNSTVENDVELAEVIVKGDANLRKVDSITSLCNTEIKGESDFFDINFTGAKISNSSISSSNFSKCDFTDSNLTNTEIEESNLEKAILSRANLFNAKLQGSAFYGAVFGDVQINEETEFGDRCVYDPEFDGESAADVNDDGTGRLTKAAGQYRIIEQLARTNAFPDMVSHNFIRRQDIHREQHRQEGRWGRWLRATASKYVLEYGENPWRLIATGLITVVGFGLLYPLVGGLQPTGGSTITLSRTINNPVLLLQSIYYSTLTFTTLGMGDFLPVGMGKVLTTLETSLGAIIIALLVFVFGRRAAR